MKNFIAKFRGLKTLQKIAICFGIAVIFYTLFGFLAAPLALKALLEKKLPEFLNRRVAIEKIRLNPYALSATVEGFSIARKEGAGNLVSFDRFYLNIGSQSIFKKALIVQSVSLTGPAVDVSLLADQTYSFSDILAPPAAEQPQEEEKGATLFSINNIEIEGGSIRYDDTPKGVVHRIDDLRLAIPSVSNLPSSVETYVQPVFSAVVNGTPISLAGGTKPFDESLATEMDLKISGIKIPDYLAYIPNPTGLTVKSALLDIDTKLSYALDTDLSSRLALTGAVTLREVEVTDKEGRSYLRLPSFALVLADSDLLAKEIRLAEIAVDSPQLDLARLADGDILPLSLLSPSGNAAKEQVEAEEAADPVRVTIDRFRLDRGVVTFTDLGLESPARIVVGKIALAADGLSTIPGTSGQVAFSLRLNEASRIEGNGALAIEPLALKTDLEVQDLQLKDFQPYISEHARIILAGGAFALQGELGVKDDATFFAGKSSIAGLVTADTLTGDELLMWKELQIREIDFSSSPFALAIGEISLEDLYTKVQIGEDGVANLATLARTDRAAPEAPEEDSAPSSVGKIEIGKVALHNGRLQFLDRSVKPSYGASLGQLSGAITGLSSRRSSLAAVDFEAKLDEQAPLAISGEINPLSEEPFADIKIDFKDFNLSPLSPYTGKYAGYKTDKGKLHLDLLYRIEGKMLESSNKVFLDQFTLGDQVDSPHATDLPVNLALALLKNRKGEIFLDIPVEGDLDDPEFSVGGVVIQVLGNLIAKAATSPFALLGSLIPEGEDLQNVLFEPGSAELTGESVDKLAIAANVLHERPGLRMDISGGADRLLDSRALAGDLMRNRVKLEKLRETGSRQTEDIDYRSIIVSGDEYPRYLEMAYKKAMEAAPKPAGETRTVEEMEKVLLAGIRIEDQELRLLAIDRANRVLGHLAEAGKVEPGRLFVVEPQLARPDGEVEPDNRTLVELLIK